MTVTNDWRVVAAGGVVVLALYWMITRDAAAVVGGAAAAVKAAVKKVSDGVTFDKSSLGPKAKLTESAKSREAAYIKQGYLERLAGGRTRITAAGERYIKAGGKM